jgi:RNA polymerase sigma factor (sigma-70 family)
VTEAASDDFAAKAGDAGCAGNEAETVLTRDRRLLREAQHGDTSKLLELLMNYRGYLFYLCGARGVVAEDDQDEVFQEVALALLEMLQKLSIKQSFGGLLAAVVRTVIRKYRGAMRRRGEELQDQGAVVTPGPPERAGRRELDQILLECVESLSLREARIIEGRVFEHLGYGDLSATLKIRLYTVHQIWRRTLVKLRTCFEKKGVNLEP